MMDLNPTASHKFHYPLHNSEEFLRLLFNDTLVEDGSLISVVPLGGLMNSAEVSHRPPTVQSQFRSESGDAANTSQHAASC